MVLCSHHYGASKANKQMSKICDLFVTQLLSNWCQNDGKESSNYCQTVVKLWSSYLKKSWNNHHDKPFPAVRNIKIDISNINNNF